MNNVHDEWINECMSKWDAWMDNMTEWMNDINEWYELMIWMDE